MRQLSFTERSETMATRINDLTGRVYGSLCVVEFAHIYHGHAYWLCRCECGSYTIARGSHLKAGNISSCGCKKGNITHGESKTRLYNIWNNMKQRCQNPENTEYHRYGGRGISVCAAWGNYATFRDWALSHGYAPNLSIDRKDNNGNYEPDNCRWATARQQANNTRQNRLIELDGQSYSVSEWARRLGIKQSTISMRINKYGWSAEKALTTEVKI
jgi:hypothetical protein